MRSWIALFESEHPRILYHGTKPDHLESIMRDGLHSSYDQSWREFGTGIYLTDDPHTAHGYGDLVLSIDVASLDLKLMVPDDCDLSDFFDGTMGDDIEEQLVELGYQDWKPSGIYECSWLDSLKIINQCQYCGDIPPQAIKVVHI